MADKEVVDESTPKLIVPEEVSKFFDKINIGYFLTFLVGEAKNVVSVGANRLFVYFIVDEKYYKIPKSEIDIPDMYTRFTQDSKGLESIVIKLSKGELDEYLITN